MLFEAFFLGDRENFRAEGKNSISAPCILLKHLFTSSRYNNNYNYNNHDNKNNNHGANNNTNEVWKTNGCAIIVLSGEQQTLSNSSHHYKVSSINHVDRFFGFFLPLVDTSNDGLTRSPDLKGHPKYRISDVESKKF